MQRTERGDELHRLVGAANATWADLEERLACFLQIVSLTPNAYIAFAIYYAPSSFKARLDVVDAVARIALEGTAFADEWKSLRERVSGKSRMRNKIVHLCPINFEDPAGKVVSGVYYSPTHPNYDRTFRNFPSYGVTAQQIDRFIEEAEKLAMEQTKLTILVRDYAQDIWCSGSEQLTKRKPLTLRTAHPKDNGPPPQ